MARSPNAGEHGNVNVTDNHQSANECNDSLSRLLSINVIWQSRNESQSSSKYVD